MPSLSAKFASARTETPRAEVDDRESHNWATDASVPLRVKATRKRRALPTASQARARGRSRSKNGAPKLAPLLSESKDKPGASAPFPEQLAVSPVSSVRDAALTLLTDAIETLSSARDDESVHLARKDCKRIRAALRLMRGCLGPRVYRRENRRIRDASKLLRPVRDACVVRDLLRTLPSCPNTLQRGLDTEYRGQRRALEQRGAQVALKWVRATRQCLLGFPVPQSEAASAIAGTRNVYKAGRKAHRHARHRHNAALHEWRKQAKYLVNELELLKAVFNVTSRKLRRRAHKLAETLGDDHDLGLLASKLRTYDARDKALMKQIRSRRCKLQARAFRLGRQLYRRRARHIEAVIAGRLSASN
jgi:CHAD domain-containing protein